MEKSAIGKLVEWLYQQKEFSNVSLKDDVLKFSFKQFHFMCSAEGGEPIYLQLILPYMTKAENTRSELIKKAMELNGEYRVGKFQLVDGALWLSAEILIADSTQIELIFSRLITILTIMGNEYKESREKIEEGSISESTEKVPLGA